jgi:PEP-CTERM motif
LAVVAMTSAARASTMIPVSNPSFEVLGPDYGGTGGDWHAFPDPTLYPSSTWTASAGYTNPYVENRVGDHFPSAPDGSNNVLFLPNAGTITQDLTYNVTAGETVTFSFYAGFDGTSGSPQLPAGSVTGSIQIGAQTVSHTFDLSSGTSQTWYLETVTATAATGGDVTISLAPSLGGHPFVDDVSVSVAAAVPEPSSLVALCGLGAMGLVLLARRRKA